MHGSLRRAILSVAIAIGGAGAVLYFWQQLSRDYEARVASVVEAASYGTRAEMSTRLVAEFQALDLLADSLLTAGTTEQGVRALPIDFGRFEGVDAIAWTTDDGRHLLATHGRPGAEPASDAVWASFAPWAMDALAAPAAAAHGPVTDGDGHGIFRYYSPVQSAGSRGALVAIIDSYDLLQRLLADEALGYELRVTCCGGTELYRRGVPDPHLAPSWQRDGWIAPTRGIRWNVAHRPTPELGGALRTSAVDTVLVVGLALATLLGGLVFETSRATERAAAAHTAEHRVRKLNRELEERVMARTQNLRDVLRDLNTINLSVSHDLRSPLNAINLNVDQLRAASTDPDSARRLEKIAASVGRMTAMLDRLLGYSRAAAFESDFQAVDMRSLAAQAVREQSLDERSVSLGDLPAARADRVITHILLSNLIANAASHGRSDRSLRIEIGSRDVGPGGPAYYVRDNGPGLDPARVEQLFRPLADRLRAGSKPGFGLGLAIVARAVDRHGGRFWVESAPGSGATFLFTLRPATQDAEPDDAD